MSGHWDLNFNLKGKHCLPILISPCYPCHQRFELCGIRFLLASSINMGSNLFGGHLVRVSRVQRDSHGNAATFNLFKRMWWLTLGLHSVAPALAVVTYSESMQSAHGAMRRSALYTPSRTCSGVHHCVCGSVNFLAA